MGLLFSNVAAAPGVCVGGDAEPRSVVHLMTFRASEWFACTQLLCQTRNFCIHLERRQIRSQASFFRESHKFIYCASFPLKILSGAIHILSPKQLRSVYRDQHALMLRIKTCPE
jgi:hypothetical protein